MRTFFGARLFDGERFLDDHALVVEDGVIRALVDVEERPRGGEAVDCGGGILAPGLVDWQINGGGGVLFNAEPTVEGVARIARAFRREGVTGFLPTVVTDAPATLAAALSAAREAERSVPGALGIHVEGPFIDPRRPGIHPPQWIRPMREADAGMLIEVQLARDAYDNCIASLDHDVGQLIDELRTRGVLEKTLLILTADHGEQFGEHGTFGHGLSLYEPEVHVRMLMIWPGRIPPGRVVGEAVSLRRRTGNHRRPPGFEQRFSVPRCLTRRGLCASGQVRVPVQCSLP